MSTSSKAKGLVFINLIGTISISSITLFHFEVPYTNSNPRKKKKKKKKTLSP